MGVKADQSVSARGGLWRSRWAAIGAAVAVTLGGGGLFAVQAASSPASSVVTIDPVRILDTRTDVGLPGPFVSAVSQKLQVTGTAVPTGATGVLLNVTVVAPTAAGFLSIRPGDATGAPSTSSLNFEAGDIVPNAVQVGLPTSGAGAGKIDITYDAFGQAGPSTEVLIDVVGYTNQLDAYTKAQTDAALAGKANADGVYTKAQTDAALAGKANADGVYSKTDADSRFLEQNQPIVITDSPRSWAPVPGLGATAPTTVDYLGAFTRVTSDANAFIWSSVTGPNSVGGTSYRLSSIEYCIEAIEAGAAVNRVVLASNESLLAGLQVVSDADNALRTTTGCFSLSVNDGGDARSYGILLRFGGDATKRVSIGAVRSTWVPVSAALSMGGESDGSLLGE